MATALRTSIFTIESGNGKRCEIGVLSFDADATVEVQTSLAKVEAASFAVIGNAGGTVQCSVDETLTRGQAAPDTGFVTVDTTSTNVNHFFYTFIGI